MLNCDDTARELLVCMDGCPKENLEGPYPIEVNGMKGHYLFCANEIAEYVALLDVEALGACKRRTCLRNYKRMPG